MLRTVAWYTNFAVSLVFKLPAMYKVMNLEKSGKIAEKDEFLNRTVSKWAMSNVKLSGARVKVYGQENIPNDIPVVFISNHQSSFDIALIMSYIDKPKGFIAKIEMLKIPLIRTWMKFINCVFIDRSTPRKSAKAIIDGVEILKNGTSLVIFPEGTRSRSDIIGEFKAGSFKLATKANVPIIPITVNGSYRLMEQNNNRIKPADVELYIHPIVETANLTKEEELELPEKIKKIISSKLPS